ncbi:MAG: 50S ribosomal protein L6 [bacterium]|nr:50S ribosomal protein L6 [bacterium]
MSRIGKKPVKIPEGVTVKIDGNIVSATGPKGTLVQDFRPEISVKQDNNNINVDRVSETAKAKSLHGLTRTLVENLLFGVSKGWNKGLEIVGVGYRAEINGTTLVLNVGFSHQVKFPAPEGITFEVKQNIINVTGIDKQKVGETAAQIRRIKPPEPYKGKGIRYVGEIVRKKAGKAAKAAGGAGAK